MKLIHVWAGFALPLPVLAGVLSSAYRADLGRLNRFAPDDWRWLRLRARRDGTIRVGKFNAGQKLNAALSGGGIAVLLSTGILMYFPGMARLSWRTGATFVHDWFALAVGLLVLGHVSYALRDPEARRGMRTGRVAAAWARTHHAAWADEVDNVVVAPFLDGQGVRDRRTRHRDGDERSRRRRRRSQPQPNDPASWG